jgi:glutaredoxin
MITVYTKQNCPQCVQAKQLLNSKNIEFSEVEVAYETTSKSPNKQYVDRTDFMERFPTVRAMPFVLNDSATIGNLADLRTYLANKQ